MSNFSVDRIEREDGNAVAVYAWPPASQPIKAAIQLSHGLAEHAGRYDGLAQDLTQAGYVVFASDHRGHGLTARSPAEYGFLAEQDGFRRVIDDLYAVNRRIATLYPELPRVLFAHSFGSFAAQHYFASYGDSVAAAVLSGTDYGTAKLLRIALGLVAIERRRVGPKNRSALLQKLTFGSYNDAFKPVRTDYDWLSRDTAEVDKYLADPMCGFAATTQAWQDLIRGLVQAEDPALLARIPKKLPIYMFAGALDPVGHAGKGPTALAKAYARAGLSQVTLKLYPGGRHEMINEVNRAEVTRDLIAWLDARFKP
jgi:alpha-beta hydrolase superfamily lysophospholipase